MQNFLLNYKPKVDTAVTYSDVSLKSHSKPIPWVEKYRPKTIDEVAHQDEVISMLKKCMTGSDFPNLLFYGPPGTGKTSTILAAARDLYGSEFFSERVLELNASDERGINVIREKVKNFSRLSAKANTSDVTRKNSVPNFKIIILDESDNMTNAAQSALRRTMESECKSTRFCLICNYITRIIDPITSRCAKFRFKPLSTEAAVERLQTIATAESVSVTDDVLSRLVELAEGDLRRAITMMQSATLLATAEKGGIDSGHLEEIAGVVPAARMAELLVAVGGSDYGRTAAVVRSLLSEGRPASRVVAQLREAVLAGPLPDIVKAAAFERLAGTDEKLTAGASEYLQLMALAYSLMTIVKA